jgi:uncharacterized protein (TIGR00730 family)
MNKSACIFCGSAIGNRPQYRQKAIDLARELVKKGYSLVYGGSDIGLMRVIADTVLSEGGIVKGVMPHLLAGREIVHREVTEMIFTETMEERKRVMGELSDCFIVMPGGIGTLDELFEVMTWNQLEISVKPIALYNVEGYWNDQIRQLDHATSEGFIRQEHRDALIINDDPAILMNKIAEWKPASSPKEWVEKLKSDTKELHTNLQNQSK